MKANEVPFMFAGAEHAFSEAAQEPEHLYPGLWHGAALDLAKDVALALRALHGLQLAHGDVRKANVMRSLKVPHGWILLNLNPRLLFWPGAGKNHG
jgi:hypothetical protein